jgi:hypothetical protein
MELRTVTAGLLSLTLASASAAQAPEAVKPLPAAAPSTAAIVTRHVQVAVGSLRGRVLSPGSRAPVAAHVLQLLDAQGSSVAKLTTDAAGEYSTPALQAGKYLLQVRSDMRLDLVVAKDATIKTLDIVVAATPEGQDPRFPPAAPGGSAVTTIPAGPSGGIGVGGVALAGAGATLAIVGVIVASGGGGGGETP